VVEGGGCVCSEKKMQEAQQKANEKAAKKHDLTKPTHKQKATSTTSTGLQKAGGGVSPLDYAVASARIYAARIGGTAAATWDIASGLSESGIELSRCQFNVFDCSLTNLAGAALTDPNGTAQQVIFAAASTIGEHHANLTSGDPYRESYSATSVTLTIASILALKTPVKAPAGIVTTETAIAEGSFSILDVSTFPIEGIVPRTGLRLLPDAEYQVAHAAAKAANKVVRREAARIGADLAGMHVHEIHPVKFGGSPTELANKVLIPEALHIEVTQWWNSLQRYLEQGGIRMMEP
jgi:hypothetical protein